MSDVQPDPAAALDSSDIPPLPDDATDEQKDQHWFKYIYQGDRVPQLTWRAVIMGAIIGMAMCCAHLYTVLAIGWSFGVAITACVMSYVIWNIIRALSGGRLTKMSILENNCMQSTASAAGYSTGSTVATAFGALLLITGAHMPWYILVPFVLCTGIMGVFIAIPMKRHMINHEQLAFPSGIAAAATLKSLYSHGPEAVRKAYALITAMISAMVLGVLKTGEGTLAFLDRILGSFRVPEQIPHDGFRLINGKQLIGFGFDPSVLLIGAGMIVGLRVSLSMVIGSALLYFWVGPQLIAMDTANLETAGYIRSIDIVRGGTVYHMYRWGLWGGTALLVCASLTAVALQWRTVARSFTVFRKGAATSLDARMNDIEVPTKWFIAGLVPVMIALLLIQLIAFHISVWLGLIAIAMAFVLSLVAARATGETDTTPSGAMGKVMQLMFAGLSPGNVPHNLISAGVAANSAVAASDLLTDLKSGYILGANPRKQFLAQFIGVFFGTAAMTACWYLMIPTKEALERYPAPATNQWKAVAELLTQGIDKLPVSAQWAILFGGLIGVALPIIERFIPKESKPYFPSALGLGLSWIIPFSNAFSFAIGAVIAWVWGLISRSSRDAYNIPVASGLVAGESLAQGVIAMLARATMLLSGGSAPQ